MLGALSASLGSHAIRSARGFVGRGAVGSGTGAAPLLADAIFCPCPCGYEHPDSFR